MPETLVKVDLKQSAYDNDRVHYCWHPDVPMADGDGFGNECPVIKFEQRHSANWVLAKILGA